MGLPLIGKKKADAPEEAAPNTPDDSGDTTGDGEETEKRPSALPPVISPTPGDDDDSPEMLKALMVTHGIDQAPLASGVTRDQFHTSGSLSILFEEAPCASPTPLRLLCRESRERES